MKILDQHRVSTVGMVETVGTVGVVGMVGTRVSLGFLYASLGFLSGFLRGPLRFLGFL